MIVTRFHDVEKLELTVEFLSPTFLGGADQNAELRSAPFKNLLRQWWRVANGQLSPDRLREEEGKLFGTVLGDEKTSASRIRISLTPANDFSVKDTLPSIGKIEHPEVKGKSGNPIMVDRLLYLGYGPVNQEKVNGKYTLVTRRFIQPGSKAAFSLHIPKTQKKTLEQTLSLVHLLGTIGGRSRNGYGSLALSGGGFHPTLDQSASLEFKAVMTDQGRKYPHALGRDDQGLLCWEYTAGKTWEDVFRVFSELYMKTRTSLPFTKKDELESRHILGYPAGRNHKVSAWGDNNGRMPSQLRLMIKRNELNQIVGRILHLPHPVPKPWDEKNGGRELEVWKKVHTFLDNQKELRRWGGNS
ncbi:MAG: hypothetical protein EOM25_12555 [Deltaproteobacteria bacterium]|nr:hypothetical protein [Deltaproteobacteria bacterium]